MKRILLIALLFICSCGKRKMDAFTVEGFIDGGCRCVESESDENLAFLFDLYYEYEDREYYHRIIECWLFDNRFFWERDPEDNSGHFLRGIGDTDWEYFGDLNRDCITNWEDMAIYTRIKKNFD